MALHNGEIEVLKTTAVIVSANKMPTITNLKDNPAQPVQNMLAMRARSRAYLASWRHLRCSQSWHLWWHCRWARRSGWPSGLRQIFWHIQHTKLTPV